MARDREFDPDVVLRRAMELFWCRGYEATSVQDLVDHLGVGRGSLYATFGGKHDLYVRALDRYHQVVGGQLLDELRAACPVLPALRRLLVEMSEASIADPARRGCLMVNAAMERVPHDPDVARRVAEAFGQVEDALHAALARAQAAGELAPDTDPRALARFLVTAIEGLRVVGKATPDRARLNDTVEVIMAALR